MKLLLVVLAPLLVAARPQAPADGPSEGPGYAIAAPAALEAVVHEETPDAEVQRLATVPGLTVRFALRGNMLRPETLTLVRRLHAPALLLGLPLERAHVEQVQKLKGMPVELDLGAGRPDAETLQRIGQLGPRPLTVRIDVVKTGLGETERALLSRLPPARILVAFGARTPGPEELQLLSKSGAQQVEVELAAAAAPEAVRAVLGEGIAVRVIADEDRVPRALRDELARAKRPVAVELSGDASLSDVERLGSLRSLALIVFRFDAKPVIPRAAASRLAHVRPPPI